MNELPKTMKGVWLTGHGELDKLDVRSDIPVPNQQLMMFSFELGLPQ